MGINRTHTTKTQKAGRWQRTSTEIESGNPQWDSLDSQVRCAVERSPRKISTISNLSPAFSILGAEWNIPHNLRNACQRLGRTRQVRPLGMLYRRDLYGGEKRGFGIGKTKRGKGTKLMAVADGAGIPLAVHATSASPHEVTLVLDTLKERFLRQRPVRLIGDRAYDSDPLDETLAKQNIELIAPHKFNRVKPTTQDGRVLRRYTRRWKIERLFAWLQNYRRVLVRHDYYLENFLGFVHLACILILMRRCF
jgi:transposase